MLQLNFTQVDTSFVMGTIKLSQSMQNKSPLYLKYGPCIDSHCSGTHIDIRKNTLCWWHMLFVDCG